MTAIVKYVRPWRSAPFPSGELYWEEREVPYPMNRREAEAAIAERWRPWYYTLTQARKQFK